MNSNDFDQLIKSIDKVLVWASVPLIAMLAFINIFVEDYISSKTLVNLIQEITAGLIPVFLLFIGSYFLLRKIQDIRKLSERNDLLQKISNMIKPVEEQIAILRELINEVINHLKKGTMNLVQYDREGLLGRDFYDKLYDGKKIIYISGVTIFELISSMLNENRSKDNLLNQLIKNENVIVKILLVHPNSHFANALNEQEKVDGRSPTPVTDKINETIDIIEILSKDNDIPKVLPFGSMLEIALTNDPITSTITYAASSNNSNEETLLMGVILPYQKGGPMYQIPKSANNQLYKDLLLSFEKQFEIAKRNHMILSWSYNQEREFNKIRGRF